MNQMLVLGHWLPVSEQCFNVLGDGYPHVALGFLNGLARPETPRKGRTVCMVAFAFRLFFNQDFKTVVVHTSYRFVVCKPNETDAAMAKTGRQGC